MTIYLDSLGPSFETLTNICNQHYHLIWTWKALTHNKPLQLFSLAPQQDVCWYSSDLNKFITPTVMSALTTNSCLSSSRFARIRTNMNLFKVHWINSIQNSLRDFHTTQTTFFKNIAFDPKAGLPHVLVIPGCGFLLILQTSSTHFHLKTSSKHLQRTKYHR